MIFNNCTARLSSLDMEMIQSVPEGGNWKDIPASVPSKRLDQIRESFKRGEGSRSTYYGRLRRNHPSYTINTYFNRPGNGCHIHYCQDRVISQREAARLQSFPDSFEFFGSQGSIHTQVGNAVPPLLAYQIAKTLGPTGTFIDLFSGAGGLGLGFKWAGWKPIIANDIESNFLVTYSKNVHASILEGSLLDKKVFDTLVEACENERSQYPLWVLGGPPCQGFSTAGKKRTMADHRNQLVWTYIKFLERLKPDGFVFENVTGLLNMEKGRVYEAVREAFSKVMPTIKGSVLSSDLYGIPQRRKRVILVGKRDPNESAWAPPVPITKNDVTTGLFTQLQPAITVEEAISDLPVLSAGENGNGKTYQFNPANVYQAFMRGFLKPHEYLSCLKRGSRVWSIGE